jgi:hypothetical protein
MARCFAFDKPTAQAISRDFHMLAFCDPDADPISSALCSTTATALLFMPAASPNRILVAKLQRKPVPSSFPEPHQRKPIASTVPEPQMTDPSSFEATGFLGLTDRLVYEAEPETARKWWQKILE